jgi:hypothetical protein
MKKSFLTVALFSAFAVAFYSCNDDDDSGNNLPSDDEALLRTAAALDYINDSDFQIGNETIAENPSNRLAETCATLTISGDTYPMTFTLDFGVAGCTTNGIYRTGVLTFTLSGPLLENGSILTVTRDNYSVNGFDVEGTVIYTNNTPDGGDPEWTRTIVSGQITTPGGQVYTHSGTRVVRQTEGIGDLIYSNNVYEVISGNHTIAREGGNSLTATVQETLVKRANCSNISQGVLSLQGETLDGELDYGDGNCDNLGVYTHSDGTSYNVILW